MQRNAPGEIVRDAADHLAHLLGRVRRPQYPYLRSEMELIRRRVPRRRRDSERLGETPGNRLTWLVADLLWIGEVGERGRERNPARGGGEKSCLGRVDARWEEENEWTETRKTRRSGARAIQILGGPVGPSGRIIVGRGHGLELTVDPECCLGGLTQPRLVQAVEIDLTPPELAKQLDQRLLERAVAGRAESAGVSPQSLPRGGLFEGGQEGWDALRRDRLRHG